MRILTIDDEQDILDILNDCLVNSGHEVVQALNGKLGLEQLAHNGPFDLILTDLSMPIMSGKEFIEQARAAGVKTDIIIISTSEFSPEDRERLDIKMVLNKPFRLNELIEALSVCAPKV